MKTKNVLLSGILGIALAGVVLTGCHKDSTNPASTSSDTDYTAAEDESNASNAMNDSKNVSDAAAQNNAGKYGPTKNIGVIYGHCTVTWSRDTTSGTDTLYVNFGPTPVLCLDGRWRQGEIIVYGQVDSGSLRKIYWDSGSVLTMTFKNYAVGNAQNSMVGVAGSRVWTNNGINKLYQQNWSFTANITLTYFSTGQTATWKSTRTNTLVLQGGVYYYEITGSATGVSRKGIGYTLSIGNPLYVTALPWWLGGCAWIESGTININRTTSTNTLSINFGNVGTCDDIAVATITTPTGSTNYTIYMW